MGESKIIDSGQENRRPTSYHAPASAGTGIEVDANQKVSNTDTGSAAAAAHEEEYNHGLIGTAVQSSEKGAAGGVATLGEDGILLSSQRPAGAALQADGFGIIDDGGTLRLAERIESNILLNFFQDSVRDSLTRFSLVDGILDQFEDETGIDAVASSGQSYNSDDDFYRPALTDTAKLLLHMDGADDGTVFADELGTAITRNGNLVTKTAVKKLGTASGYFDGAGDYLSMELAASREVNGLEFTYDFWFRASTADVRRGLFAAGDFSGTYADSIDVELLADNTMQVFFRDTGRTPHYVMSNTVFAVDTWYHIAIVREITGGVGTLKLYVNGVLDVSGAGWTGAVEQRNNLFYIGTYTADMPFAGYIDEFRFSHSARWRENFVPPVEAYVLEYSDMALISAAFEALADPDNARLVLFEEDISAGIVLNTDMVAYVSRDDGTTWEPVVLASEGNYGTGKRILSGLADISGQPSGTDVRWKLSTSENVNIKVHGIGLNWR